MRDKGFIVLDKDNVCLNYKDNKQRFYNWVKILDDYYFFKPATDSEAYRELFGSLVADALSILTVSYDLAMLDGVSGVICRDYNPLNLKEVSIGSIVYGYDRECFFNLETIWDALWHYYGHCDNKSWIVYGLMKDIVDSFILQICIGDGDLHGFNLHILDGDEPRLVPNYDYGKAFMVDLDSYDDYMLKVGSMFESSTDTIKSFLDVSSSEYRNYFFEKIKMLPTSESIVLKVEEKIKATIPDYIKSSIVEAYDSYRDYLLGLMEENVFKR